ncbi:hypothetical protein THF1A12_530022 [Vibrio jasicida]|uniref:Prevent-host-death protein n=1 Tax=Vibrio jasicida TaxID=766224 RepID=A0AAU9QU96_9VIBR|nr:hypothetical protein THF1A12_530022 [Vibrio jasicida]
MLAFADVAATSDSMADKPVMTSPFDGRLFILITPLEYDALS